MQSSGLFVGAGVLVAATALLAAPASAQFYEQHNLQTDQSDTQLVNAWGLTSSATSPWWVADNGQNVSTLYDSAGNKQGLVVTVPGAPTGAVFNLTASSFVLSAANNTGGKTGKALFIFATESGTILAWNNSGSPATAAAVVVPSPSGNPTGAIYKGLAIADLGSGHARLYATDFHNAKVDVYDENFSLVMNSGFEDPTIPAGYAPFGIQTIGGTVFVTYAQQDDDAEDDVPGPGHGFVDAFDTAGNWLARVTSRGQLNSPWGIALAPNSFGEFGGKLLIGNFGNGQVNAFDLGVQLSNGEFERVGFLHGTSGRPLAIDGLWSLQFGKGGANGTPNQLFFTAGPNHESGGLFGFLTVAAPPGQNGH